MELTPAAFAALMRSQSNAVATATEPTIEHVSASVRRVAGLTNAGRAGSGHHVAVDEPTQFGGSGAAADPAELMLVAIGASLSVTLTVHAALAGVPVEAIDIALSGQLDAGRFFMPVDKAGGGFSKVAISVSLTTHAAPARVRALFDNALLACPILRSVDAQPATSLTINGAPA